MENSIQDKIWDIRIFGYTVWINKCPNNDIKIDQPGIATIPGKMRNNIHGRHFGIFRYQG